MEPLDEHMENNSEVSNANIQPEAEGADVASNKSGTGPTGKGTKRKHMRPRSIVWSYFTQNEDENGNETSSLKQHMAACKGNLECEPGQTVLNLQPCNLDNDGRSALTAWKFDQDEIRKVVAYMVIVDELPFKFVEGEGFRRVMSKVCPRFKISSRWTMSRGCFQLYAGERIKLKHFMKNNCQRVSLTTDTWTSVQKINYMCITAHFIDNDWNLHKKILSFVPVNSHRGEYIRKAIEACVLDWGLKNIFTVTVDNASSNDVAIAFFKRRMLNWGGSGANCKFLHMRCIAYIITLVVTEGLKDIKPSVKRVREAVRYIRNSPARLKKFKDCVDWESIESKSFLCLDVAIRWNSTYLMLKTTAQFEKAFERFEEQEPYFATDLAKHGVPTSFDWSCVKKISDLLKHFYEMTLRISASLYVTSHTFFNEISNLCCILNEWKESDDYEIKDLGTSMKSNEMYEAEQGVALFESIRNGLFELFKEYERKYQPNVEDDNRGSSSSVSPMIDDSSSIKVTKKPVNVLKARYKQQKLESEVFEDSEDLDVLKWWKINSGRFHVLSTGGRVLNVFRSSLTPKIVEALICARDWLRGSNKPLSVEELQDEETKFAAATACCDAASYAAVV
ncbi:HAT family dimerisation domain containing protein [Striga asiatica]|uniref:HAT family dimerisation domain containing protein n=1 Tax=Striga asiatica TaxID=4170 RepID=A0A5A7Q2A3_STRAF|nr:HAT family dimerisation domain containing protein [Striga asiatica]